MKKSMLNLIVLVFFTFGTTMVTHGAEPDPSALKKVREQIVKMIQKPDLSYIDFDQVESTVHFLVNKNSEVVVLYVDTKDEFVDNYLKSRLNYKQLKDTQLRGRYAMKVTLKNGSF